ncbi:MAG: LysR substrate-binding domain-containing protein [Mycobacteriales bacterium]
MDIRQLRCFIAVAEELHFGRAAERLHVAQPAVSQTIKGLERELGLTVLERSNRRVVLTAAGAVLLVEARAVVGRLDGARTVMRRLKEADRHRLTIGAVPALPPDLVPALLERVRDELPDLEVSLRTLPPSPRLPDVLDLDGGLSLVLLRTAQRAPGIATRVVAREPVGVALPAAHPLCRLAEVPPEALNGKPLVTFARAADPQMHDDLFGALAARGFTGAGVTYESASGAVDASLRLVATGTAVSLKLASEVASFAHSNVVWRPIAGPQVYVVVVAAWRRDRAAGALGQLLRRLPRVTTDRRTTEIAHGVSAGTRSPQADPRRRRSMGR